MANAPQLTVGLGFDLDEASAKKVVKGMEQLGAYLEKAANDSAKKVENTWRTSLSRVGSNLENVGGRLSATLSLPMALLGSKIVEATRDFDRLKQSLTAITGSTGAMNDRLAELTEIAKAPGIGFEQAIQGDVRLRAVGISAKQSASALKEFANAIAFTGGTSAQLDLVTYQLGQMSAKGKVLGNDLRPIIEQAPAVAGALKGIFGTIDSEQISNKLTAMGKISTDFIGMLVEKLKEVPRVQGGFNNAIENMGIAIKSFFARIGESLFSSLNLEKMFKGIESGLNSLASVFENMSPSAKRLVLVIGALATIAPPVLLAIGAITAAIAAISAPVLAIVGVVGAASVMIIEHWESISSTLTNSGLFKGLVNLFGGMFEVLSGMLSAFGNLFTGQWDGLWENIKNIFKGLNNAIIGIFQSVIGTVGKGMAQLLSSIGMTDFGREVGYGTDAFIQFGEKSKYVLANTSKVAKSFGSTFNNLFGGGYGGGGEIKKGLKNTGESVEEFQKKIAHFEAVRNFARLRGLRLEVERLRDSLKLFGATTLPNIFVAREQQANLGEQLRKSFDITPLGDQLEQSTKNLQNKVALLQERIKPTLTNFGKQVSGSFNEMLTLLKANVGMGVEFLGDFLATGLASVFNKNVKFDFSKMLGGFLSAVGDMFIKMATSMIVALGFANIASGGVLAPQAIAAGKFLAAGIAMKAGGMAISGGSSNNVSPSENSSYQTQFKGAMGSQGGFDGGKVVFELQGTTLRGVLNNTDKLHG